MNTNDSFKNQSPPGCPSWLKPTAGGAVVSIRVVPRSQHDVIQGALGDALKVRLRAPPVDNKANRALLDFLAEQLSVPPGRCMLQSGETSRTKRVAITGLDWRSIAGRLRPASEVLSKAV